MPRTLTLYIMRVFLGSIIMVVIGCMILIYLVDLSELLRRASGRENVDFLTVAMMAIFKLPGMTDKGLPIMVFVAAMVAFYRLSRRQELVVARAAGVSVWQFVGPACMTAFLFGVFVVGAFNPISAYGTGVYEHLQAQHFLRAARGLFGRNEGKIWLRQSNAIGSAVISAQRSAERGVELYGVVAYQLDEDDKFLARIGAERATLEPDRWYLQNAWIMGRDGQPTFSEEYWIETTLSRTEVAETLTSPSAISFWDLPKFIRIAERAGLRAHRYRVHYHALLAQPVLFAVMVLVAAIFSIRVTRFGHILRMIVGALGVGLVLFMLTHVSRALGGGGALPATVAAWWPVLLAMVATVATLFYQEDG